MGAKQQVQVVGDQSPRIADSICFCQQFVESFSKVNAIVIIDKNIFTLDATHDNVMEKVGAVDTGLSWHARSVAHLKH